MKRILIIQCGMEPWFGGNVVMALMLEALKNDYAATMISWAPADLDQVNRTFGTGLGPEDVRVVTMPPWLRFLLDRAPSRSPISASTFCSGPPGGSAVCTALT